MAPSIQFLRRSSSPALKDTATHVVKKRKVALEDGLAWAALADSYSNNPTEDYPSIEEELDDAPAVPPHILGIKPSGNAYDAPVNIKGSCGSFTLLPDELILHLLEYLEAVDLLKLRGACKALYAFTASEDLWKQLFIESSSKSVSWRGTWRSTFLSLPHNPKQSNRISCAGLYSDALYLPFHRAHVPLSHYAENIPARNQILRLDDLTAADFNANYASKPFILTSPVREWPIFKEWSVEHLMSRYSDTVFRVEAVDWTFKDYINYMQNNSDESPLYLFDCRFAEKMGLLVGDSAAPQISITNTIPSTSEQHPAYKPPSCFSPDLFMSLGPHRPDNRWLIIGPARSGSTFHADPNATSAWNAVIRGSKYWILFPPSISASSSTDAPTSMPGLHISHDSSHITAPLSIAEYLVTFHAEARRHPGAIEAVCYEGEVLHVPSGWFHLVLNLEDGIALTQNFVPPAHLADVLSFLRDKREQVSGFGKKGIEVERAGGEAEEAREYELFVERLRVEHPETLEEAMKEWERKDEKMRKKSKWKVLTGKEKKDGDVVEVMKDEAGGFSFGFGFEGGEGDEGEIGAESEAEEI